MTTFKLASLEKLRARVDYQGAMLALVCASITALLVYGQQKTYAPIQQRLAEDRQAMFSQVLPQQYYDNQPLKTVITATDPAISSQPFDIYVATKNAALAAYVFQVEVEGYGGTITLMLSISVNGEILGVRVLSHKETPGLADKIEISKSDWIRVFNGESLKKTNVKGWAVKKDGGKFDQFTGATITPRAIVKGVYNGLIFYANNNHLLADQLAQDHEALQHD